MVLFWTHLTLKSAKIIPWNLRISDCCQKTTTANIIMILLGPYLKFITKKFHSLCYFSVTNLLEILLWFQKQVYSNLEQTSVTSDGLGASWVAIKLGTRDRVSTSLSRPLTLYPRPITLIIVAKYVNLCGHTSFSLCLGQ